MASHQTTATPPPVDQLCSYVDWQASPIGPPAGWTARLSATWDMMRGSPAQIVLFWGPDYVALYNDAYAPTIGRKHPGAFGRPAREYWTELWDDLKPLLDGVRTTGKPVFAKDRPFQIERAGTLEHVTFDIAYSAIRSTDENVAGVLCIVKETTDRTRLERDLRESEERWKAITNSIDQMIWSTLPDGYHDYYNHRWYEYTGVPHGSTDGEAWNNMFHPDDQHRAWAVWRHCLETGDPYHIEYRLRHRSGAYRWVIGRAKCQRDASGAIRRWYGSCTDIHELKAADLQRAEISQLVEEFGRLTVPDDIAYASAAMLGRTLAASRVGYGTIDPVAETITPIRHWCAPGVVALSGPLPFRDYGTFVDDLKAGHSVIISDASQDPRTAGKADLLKSISAQALVNMPITERDGLVAIVFINNATPRQWQADEITFIGEVAERTRVAVERRRAERELRALTVTLETQVAERTAALMKTEEQLRQAQKMEAVGQLTGGIAHDFNNLLQAIGSNLQLLSGEVAGQPRAEQRILNALSAVDRGSKLASQLLSFSRRQPLTPKVVNCGRLVAGLEELLRRTLGETVEVKTIIPPDLWNSRVDTANLESAVINLALNGRDAMSGRGLLAIRLANTTRAPRADDSVAKLAADYVRISVSDTGCGMPAEIVDKVFDPFFTTKPPGAGTGLGLSMVYGFVTQSGGHVEIDTSPGRGTAVHLFLPRSREAEEIVSDVRETAVAGGTETILVVEDDEAVREAVVAMIRDLGYAVFEATDAVSALQQLRIDRQIDLLFTDVVMPGTRSSSDLARRAREQRPGLKVLFTSGFVEKATGIGLKIDSDYQLLRKPYTREALARRLRFILDRCTMPSAPELLPNSQPQPDAALRVLVCEDDMLIRMGTVDMLEELGHSVIEAGDARSALDILDREAVDVVMTDIGLPGMSGIELADIVRAQRPAMPIIFATGRFAEDLLLKDDRMAAIGKPYTSRALQQVIQSMAERLQG